MMQTHVEYDDFGEYVETIDLEPVAVPQEKSPGRRPGHPAGVVEYGKEMDTDKLKEADMKKIC